MSECKTIAIANRKGGVGKTTTTFSLGVALANEGKKVLLIDTDPQADLTTSMGFYEESKYNISTLLEQCLNEETMEIEKAILHHKENVDLIPSSENLVGTEKNIFKSLNRENILNETLKEIKNDYDYILIDTMPSLSILTTNVLATADKVIIPVQSQYLSAKALGDLLNVIVQVKQHINYDLEIEGILLTQVDSRTKLPKEIRKELEDNYGNFVNIYEEQIPFSIKAPESTSRGKSIFAYDKNGKVANAYLSIAKEVLKNNERTRENALAKGVCR